MRFRIKISNYMRTSARFDIKENKIVKQRWHDCFEIDLIFFKWSKKFTIRIPIP